MGLRLKAAARASTGVQCSGLRGFRGCSKGLKRGLGLRGCNKDAKRASYGFIYFWVSEGFLRFYWDLNTCRRALGDNKEKLLQRI